MDFAGILLDDPYTELQDLADDHIFRLPPVQEPAFFSHRRPSPLEPSAGQNRVEEQNTKAKLASGSQKSGGGLQGGELAEPASGLHHLGGGSDGVSGAGTTSSITRPGAQQLPKTALPLTINLRLLEKGGGSSDSFDQDGSRKKLFVEDFTEKITPDFVKLPKPRARLTNAQRDKPTFGPIAIVNGLVEPPPNAALLPPIAPEESKWKARDAVTDVPNLLQLPVIQEPETNDYDTEEPPAAPSTDTAPSARKETNSRPENAERAENKDPQDSSNVKPRRKFIKWTTEETNTLLQGVHRFGIGKWKEILEFSDYSFNNRNATDLKDRFRVVCPEVWKKRPGRDSKSGTTAKVSISELGNDDSETTPLPSSTHKTSGILTSNILLPQSSSSSPEPPKSAGTVKPKKTAKPRAHALSASTLQSMGIASFTPSTRRTRRPFTPAEDANLKRGMEKYGFSWAQIQRDPEFNLGHRKSTDLRDRIRNLDPEKYQSEKQALKGGAGSGGSLPWPSAGNDGSREDGKLERDPKTSIASVMAATTELPKDPSSMDTNRNGQKPGDQMNGIGNQKTQQRRRDFSSKTLIPNLLSSSSDTASLTPMSLGFGSSLLLSHDVSMNTPSNNTPSAGAVAQTAFKELELPALTSALGDNPFDETGGLDIDWGDNTLPKLSLGEHWVEASRFDGD